VTILDEALKTNTVLKQLKLSGTKEDNTSFSGSSVHGFGPQNWMKI